MNEQDLRDVFAMFAMNGLIATTDGSFDMEAVAKSAYKQADFMLEARKPEETIGLPAIKRKAKAK